MGKDDCVVFLRKIHGQKWVNASFWGPKSTLFEISLSFLVKLSEVIPDGSH